MSSQSFSPKPCGPANKELEDEMERRVFNARRSWDMKQASENMEAEGAPTRFRNALTLSLTMEKFGGKRKTYSQEEWARLVFCAFDEGPPTQKLQNLYNEVERLQICHGDLTIDDAIKGHNAGMSKKDFEAFMHKLPIGVQDVAHSHPSAHTWKGLNGEALCPRPQSRRSHRSNLSARSSYTRPTKADLTDPTVPSLYLGVSKRPLPKVKISDMFASLPDQEEEETATLDIEDKDQFPSMPKSPPKIKPEPRKKVITSLSWNPNIVVKHAKQKKGRRNKKKK